jgi:hypothetical protein
MSEEGREVGALEGILGQWLREPGVMGILEHLEV